MNTADFSDDTVVLNALREAVDSAGADHVYAMPEDGLVRYTWDAESRDRGDLIGDVIRLIDPDVYAQIKAVENADQGQPLESVYGVTERFGIQFSGAAAFALNDAQIVQDEGGTWGEALDRYEAAIVEWDSRAVV